MFEVKIQLMIKGYADDGTLFIAKTESGRLPNFYAKPEDDFYKIGKGLFLAVTGMLPEWAGLKSAGWVHEQNTIVILYEASIALTDKLNGYKWEQYNA